MQWLVESCNYVNFPTVKLIKLFSTERQQEVKSPPIPTKVTKVVGIISKSGLALYRLLIAAVITLLSCPMVYVSGVFLIRPPE